MSTLKFNTSVQRANVNATQRVERNYLNGRGFHSRLAPAFLHNNHREKALIISGPGRAGASASSLKRIKYVQSEFSWLVRWRDLAAATAQGRKLLPALCGGAELMSSSNFEIALG